MLSEYSYGLMKSKKIYNDKKGGIHNSIDRLISMEHMFGNKIIVYFVKIIGDVLR